MSVYSVCPLLSHAHHCGAAQLRAFVMHHIHSQLAVVVQTEEWAATEPELQQMVLAGFSGTPPMPPHVQ